MNCLALEYGDRPLHEVLFELSDEWVLFDPFGNFWHQDSERNFRGIYTFSRDTNILFNDPDWINTVILFDARTVDLGKVLEAPRLDKNATPDWGLRYDYFLLNFKIFSDSADFCVFPELWYPDAPGGNAVMLCRHIGSLRNLNADLITPITPESVLRAWRINMIDYLTVGTGLTGQLLRPPG